MTFLNKKAKKQGIDVSRSFIIVKGNYEEDTGGEFRIGTIIRLEDDDNTSQPLFSNQSGDSAWIFWKDLWYAELNEEDDIVSY